MGPDYINKGYDRVSREEGNRCKIFLFNPFYAVSDRDKHWKKLLQRQP
jgi:hypothetical protein